MLHFCDNFNQVGGQLESRFFRMGRMKHAVLPRLIIGWLLMSLLLPVAAMGFAYRLGWDRVRGAVGYNLYRSDDGSTFERLNSNPLRTTIFCDSTIEPQVTYTYYVTSISKTGVESLPSKELRVYTGTEGDINGDDLFNSDDLIIFAYYLADDLRADDPLIDSFRRVDLDDNFVHNLVDLVAMKFMYGD